MTGPTVAVRRHPRRPLPALALAGGAVVAIGVLVACCVSRRQPSRAAIDNLIEAAAMRHNVDANLIRAVIKQESGFHADVRGKAGEYGLMQITLSAAEDWQRVTRRSYGSPGALFDPALNIEIGSWYLARALRSWQSHDEAVVLALAEYNAGRTRALAWQEASAGKNIRASIPFASTRQYIDSVLTYQRAYQQEK